MKEAKHNFTSLNPVVPDVPTYESDDEQISWKSSDEDDDDEENVSEHEDDDDGERTESDNDGDDFFHPKFSTYDDEAMQDEEVNEEDSFDPRVQTPSHVESTDDEDSDAKQMSYTGTPEGQQQSSSVSSGFISNMLNPRPDTVPTPTIVPSSPLKDLPNFGSLFGFDHILKTLETEFFEFKQTNEFAKTVSSILGIVDAYLANKMNEAIKIAIQLQSDRLRDEAQSENEDFLNKLDDNIKKIIKDQVKEQVKAQVSKIFPRIEKTVNEQLEAGVMTRSSTESKTSLAIAANL
ncbi:hypothetical protein Tco_1355698 [Tanacetum coccineum]